MTSNWLSYDILVVKYDARDKKIMGHWMILTKKSKTFYK